MPTTEREKEAHDEKPEIEIVEDVDVDLGNLISSVLKNEGRGVVVTLIRVRYIMAEEEQ